MAATTGHWDTVDPGPYDPADTDQAKIGRGLWVPCRLCERAFQRLRLTRRYCATCRHAYCEGEHLNFAASNGRARCTSCGDRALRFFDQIEG